MRQSEVEDSLHRVMSHTEWKRPSTITDELNKFFKAKNPDKNVHIALAQVFVALEKAKDEDWVESRVFTGPKTLGSPRGELVKFRLKGIGRRMKLDTTQSRGFFGGSLKPA